MLPVVQRMPSLSCSAHYNASPRPCPAFRTRCVKIRDYVNSLEAHLTEAHRQAGRMLMHHPEKQNSMQQSSLRPAGVYEILPRPHLRLLPTWW